LEISESALRLTPDDWQFAIFRGDNPTRWRSKDRAGQRDRIEGKLVEVGMRVAKLGTNVVFDFGLWGKDERSALRWIADTLGVRAPRSSTYRLTTRSSADASSVDTRPRWVSSR
jgi:predicted kinase